MKNLVHEAALGLFEAAWDRPVAKDREQLTECQAFDDALASFTTTLGLLTAHALQDAADAYQTMTRDMVSRGSVVTWLREIAALEVDAV